MNGAPAPPQVVIVGAGPTGLTAATLLARHGIRCVVLDRYNSVYPQPRAVHLDDEVYRVIARLGIAERFATISRPAGGLRLLDADHTVLAQVTRDPRHRPNGYPQANMFDQPDLESLLRASLENWPTATLLGNVEVTSLDEQADGVRVSYTDRASGARHALHASFALGCDGANSMVRAAIGTRMRDLRFQQRWLVVDVATAADLGRWEGVEQVCDPRRAATYMRIGPERYRWEFQLLAGETADTYAGMDALRGLLKPWTGDLGEADLHLLRVAEYTFRAQVADRWRRGRVFILGDAAHLTPPFIGQGMGAGLRDAFNLSWKLAAVLRGELPPDVLDTYEQERKPHARRMIQMALTVGWAMTAGGRPASALRRLLLPRLHRMPVMGKLLADSRTPQLPASALVDRSRRRGRLPGTLCPNPVMPDGRRLDDVLADGFAVITTAVLAQPPRGSGLRVVTATPDSELASWLDNGHATAALVRPDRTVWRAGSIARVTAAL